jgi:hypothetical protein
VTLSLLNSKSSSIIKKGFEKELKNIVEQLIRIYAPKKIILFDSLLKRNKAPKDIDLFIELLNSGLRTF